MIAAALLSASTSASLKSSAAMTTMSSTTTTTTTTTSMKTTEQQVRTLIPVTTADGSKLFVSGPCIVLKTQTPAPTVAQQVQALRPLLKADINSNKKAGQGQEKKPNDRNNNNNNNNTNINEQIKNITTTTPAVSKKSSTSSNVENEPEPLRCKRRIDFTSLGLPRPQPAAMARRNERERNRVKQVNLGFETLRQHVPQGRKNKKLSKVDTLKEAVKYIKYLHQVLMETEDDADSTALTDTITMVSRSSPITTTSSPKAESVITPAQTSSTATASTNTSGVTTMDFSSESTPNVMGSGPADFHVNSSSVFKLDPEPSDCSPDELKHFGQLTHVHDFNNMPQPHHHPAEAVKNASSDHFLDLTPAQIRFSHAEQSTPSPMDVEPMGVSTHPGTDLAPLPTIFTASSSSSSSSASSAVTFMNFIPSSTDSSRLDVPPTRLGPGRQSFRVAEQGCRGGSEGSCPVSPSQSSGASDESPGEEYLGVPGCEPWQDLSADIAEWLCSKIDIDDPDVFV